MTHPAARQAATDEDYRRLGIRRGAVSPREDAAHTDDSPGTYEWWYFDAHLSNGATLVVIFMNKPLAQPELPLTPLLRVSLELPDGRVYNSMDVHPAETWSASRTELDVRIGANRFSGDLDEIRIQAASDDIVVDVTMTPQVHAWRPETGHMYFGEGTDQLFGWLPAIPQGAVQGSYTIDGETHEVSGIGYHDHNWGDASLPEIVHDWYWARGQAGPFSTITSFITAAEDYGYGTIPIFLLARDGVPVADDAEKVVFDVEGVYTDEETGKPVATTTRYRYTDGEDEYTVEFVRDRDLVRRRMGDDRMGDAQDGADKEDQGGAYLRFAGTLEITHRRGGELVETHREESAVWELMYFGPAREPEITR